MSSTVEGHEWERVLWKRHRHPDNFVPKTFLSSLSKNANFQPYTYWYLVFASSAVTQHLATIFVFLATFVRLKERYLDPRILVWISVSVFLVGYLTSEILDYHSTEQERYINRAKAIKSSILVFLALLSLSPVLRTLTAATSSDSIWALSASLFILNVVLADYSAVRTSARPTKERLTSVLSMNAAISSSVVLASRLVDDLSVFALVLFSIQSFALFPALRRRLQNGPKILTGLITLMLLVTSIVLTASLSVLVASLYAVVFTFMMFGAPGLLIWAQRFKNELRGTWDPAVPKLNVANR